jgi:hypothetical protein
LIQANLQTDLEIGYWPNRIIKMFDYAFMQVMQIFTVILPNYVDFSTADYVALGFNISPQLMYMMLLRTLVYFSAVSLIGFFFLKTREVASS